MKDIISYGQFPIKELAPHKNKGMEITYIEKDLLEWMVEGRMEKVEAGSVFFTLPWQVHGSLLPKEPDNLVWHVLFHLELDYSVPQPLFSFSKSLGFTPEEMRIISSTFAASDQHCFQATPAMRDLMPALVRELQSEHVLRDAHAQTLLRAVIVELKRIVAGRALNHESRTPSERKVQDLITNFSSTCNESWTLASMADSCGIKRTQLGKIFLKLTGISPTEYLFRIRMERAKTLLRRTNLKIIDIAFDCGYASSQYFANTFRQAIGMSPSEYREHIGGVSVADSKNWDEMKFRSEDEELRRVEAFSEQGES
jgi:AraC family L-rhamnose operon regulatory protein RhaS